MKGGGDEGTGGESERRMVLVGGLDGCFPPTWKQSKQDEERRRRRRRESGLLFQQTVSLEGPSLDTSLRTWTGLSLLTAAPEQRWTRCPTWAETEGPELISDQFRPEPASLADVHVPPSSCRRQESKRNRVFSGRKLRSSKPVFPLVFLVPPGTTRPFAVSSPNR